MFIADGSGLSNLEAKIGRAYKHVQEFDSIIVQFCRSNPYTVSQEDDLVNQRHIRRCVIRAIAADVYLSLADMIYSLRSGLDQLAWQLALLGNPEPSRDVMFPIHSDTKPKSEERFQRMVCDIPPEAVVIIKKLQPYNRGDAFRDDPLWQLNELSNMDKHRTPTSRAMLARIYAEPLGFVRRELDDGVEVSWPLAMKDSVVFKPNMPSFVFGDPFNSARDIPLELTREEVIKIYNFVREEVKPRFERFFPSLPDSEGNPIME